MPRYARIPSIGCRICGCKMNTVTDSHVHHVTYHDKKRTVIKRYRKCRHCGFQFTTIETYEDEENTCLPEDIQPFKPPAAPSGVYCPPPPIPPAVAAGDDILPPKKPQASSPRQSKYREPRFKEPSQGRRRGRGSGSS